MDDSTLLVNGPNFLTEHLREVVAQVQEERTSAQLQIGCEAEGLFPLTARVTSLHDMGAAPFGPLDRTLLEPSVLAPNVG